MAIPADVALARTPPLDDLYGSAPVSQRRMRRSLVMYALLFFVALTPVLLGASSAWQAFGLGLLFPGGGLLAVGGWCYALFPVVLVLMMIACALMLLTGNAFAPLFVWLGSAALASALVSAEIEPASIYVVPLVSVGFVGWIIYKHRRMARAELARRERRNAYLPRAEQQVLARAAPRPANGSRELSPDELAHLRFALDRGLQPVESFDGFHVIEQFQTSALRYQINNLLWALQLAQCHYTPNFHGYLSLAQRNLIDKLTVPKVWKWWRWESLFGNFSLNANPIAKDNIMFGGFSSAHIALYTAHTGDDHYLKPGSLSFRLNRFRTYRHDLRTILEAGRRNHETAVYGPLYPCEPNLTYSACNLQGNFAHLVADRIFNTHYGQTLAQTLQPMHVSEMMCRDGAVHAGRVVPLGIRIPVYTSNQVEALWGWMANAFFPELSRRVWATLREESVRFDEHGEIELDTKSYDRMDMGNYQKSECGPYTQFLVLAREHGDDQVAEAILRKFDRDFGRIEREGCVSYSKVSVYNMGHMIMGLIGRTGDIRAMVLDGPPAGAMKGPLLTDARYPDVLVAKAYSNGTDLDLVLYPGTQASRQRLQLERLRPNGEYRVESLEGSWTLRADNLGKAALEIDLHGRTQLRIQPFG
jgi:hypothetical protein